MGGHTKNHSALNTGVGNMVLSIYCSELTVNDLTPVEADENGYVFVSGMDVVNSNGNILFSVGGSDEYSATVHNVQHYEVKDGGVIATVKDPSIVGYLNVLGGIVGVTLFAVLVGVIGGIVFRLLS